MAEENEFPTIRNLRDRLSTLIEMGLGDLAVQIVVVPDSTIQSLAKHCFEQAPYAKPAIMIEFEVDARAFGISFITTERLTAGGGMPSTRRQ